MTKNRNFFMNKIVFTVIVNLFFIYSKAQYIFPTPVSVNANKYEKPFLLDKATAIVTAKENLEQAKILQQLIQQQTGLSLKIRHSTEQQIISSAKTICFNSLSALNPIKQFRDHHHQIIVRQNNCSINYSSKESLVNAIYSFVQLLPIQTKNNFEINAVTINDYPTFSYRGMHLDVSRHFFSVDFIKKYIDYLAFHKMNIFHWHLTDDQGWRIEIKKYPELIETSSKRLETLVGHFKDSPIVYDKTPYSGFYTQVQIKDIVQYALHRGINIVPEIDIPGHSMALLAAMPYLGTVPDSPHIYKVATTWGMYNRQNNVLAPYEKTFEVLDNIFTEVAALFPYKYVHIGGDEASKKWWKNSEWTQKFIAKNNLKGEDAVQSYFITRVEKLLNAKGKTIIGWDEILEGGLAPNAIVMSWRGEKGGIAAAKQKHYVVMTPGKPLYFDNYQTKLKNDSLAIHGYNSFKAVYEYNPIAKELDSLKLGNYVLGAQGNVWTEYMASEAKVEYMVFPRMAALAEVLWRKEKLPYKNFKIVVKEKVLPYYHLWKVNYCKVWEEWE
jgi:hexosaminidase